MKTLPLLAVLAALAAAPAFAHDDDAPAAHGAAAKAKSGEGVGVVKSVDAKAGTITLHHGPVAALGWPAMTMPFKAKAALIQAVKPGEKVKFTVTDGDTPEITAIAAQ
jgi:Cu(I)/Ag(I) efflux system protein CusF